MPSLNLPFILGIANGEKLIGMGWGETATSNFSPVLKENVFTTISDSMCESFYKTELDSTILCTRDVPGQSICQGNKCLVQTITANNFNKFHEIFRGLWIFYW